MSGSVQRRFFFVMMLVGAVAGCQQWMSAVQDIALPTAMVLPSLTPTSIPTETTTPLPPTWTPPASATNTPTPTDTLTPTPTPLPTETPTATLTSTPSPSPTQIGDAKVSGRNGANLRSGPGTQYTPALALLPQDTELVLAGKSSDLRWFEIRLFDGRSGWVFADLVQPRRDVASLRITWIFTPTPPPAPVIVVPPVSGVNNAPPGSLALSDRARQILNQGRQLGNRANAFSKVGDSITASQPFFLGFDNGDYELGSYGYLQDTVSYFNGSFGRSSMAAASAFNAAAVLASVWSDPANCLPQEIPLDCEYRLQKPSAAIIMLGSVDMQIYDSNSYRTYMEMIVQDTLSKSILPVLTTFPNAPDFFPQQANDFNAILRDIAGREQIPLVELRDPALALPDSGVGPDKFHLSFNGGWHIAFNGEEQQYGLTLRDLLTLQMLDAIRRG